MTWTAARPTKPGKYWLSIGIDHREKFASDVCREPHHVYLLDIFEEGGGLWLDGVIELGYCLPASALFNSYIEPADPFAESVPSLPSLRRRVEALMRFDVLWIDYGLVGMGPIDDGDYLRRSEVLALIDEVTRCME